MQEWRLPKDYRLYYNLQNMKVFDLNYLLFCDHAIQDAKGKISLIGIFENFNAKQYPSLIASFVVAGSIKLYDENVKNAKFDMVILDPNNKPMDIKLPTLNIDYIPAALGGEARNINLLFTINSFKIPQQGRYKFEVSFNSQKVGVLNLEAKIIN